MKKEYQLEFLPKAKKGLLNIPDQYYPRVMIVINRLALDPYIGKKLKGQFLGYYVVRAWPYRIIYSISELEIKVYLVDIGHRKDVYR